MQATLSLVLGVVLGAVLVAIVGRGAASQAGPPSKPTALGWCALSVGLLAAAAWGSMSAKVPVAGDARVSVALAAAAVVAAVGALTRRDRHWPTWVGLGAGAIPALFWVVFAVGEVIGPPH